MKREYKIALMLFGGSMVILGAFLWMPLYLAGPDGLERVMFDLTNNEEYEPDSNIEYESAPFPDYSFKISENTYIHTWLIGLIGAIIVGAVMFGIFKLVKIKHITGENQTESTSNEVMTN
ncbi:MAG: PDGLE domain-containing protein [Candidatus Lokiarchaeota archaeon]|nr:PDGLE domain-containing protein [Candidatus Harpocratesius repetitus]